MTNSAKYEKQRNRIIDASSNIFLSKGYSATTVDDLLAGAGIAKGTFYHYFKSKDEIFDAVIAKYLDEIMSNIQEIAEREDLSALEKLEAVAFRPRDNIETQLHDQFTQRNDLLVHFKSHIDMTTRGAPILAKVIEQGVAEGVFHTDHPMDFAELMLFSETLLDNEIFELTPEDIKRNARFRATLAERYLKTPEGAFDFLWKVFDQPSEFFAHIMEKKKLE